MKAVFTKIMEDEISALISLGYYRNEEELLKDAIRTLFNTRAELKVVSAIEMYTKGKVSLSKAAEIAGITTIEFKDVLADRGVVRKTEGKKAEEMDEKIKRIL